MIMQLPPGGLNPEFCTCANLFPEKPSCACIYIYPNPQEPNGACICWDPEEPEIIPISIGPELAVRLSARDIQLGHLAYFLSTRMAVELAIAAREIRKPVTLTAQKTTLAELFDMLGLTVLNDTRFSRKV